MSYNKAFVGDNVGDFTYSAKNAPFTGVNVHLDDGNDVFVGDEGNVLEVTLPVCNSTEAAEQYAQYILDSLSNYQYQPYEADGALLNPAVQVGDGVTIRSVYGGIYTKDTKFGKLMRAKVSSPYTEEVDTEYPFIDGYERKETRKYKRLEAHMESEFDIQAGMISAKVSQISPAGQTSFSWEMTNTAHKWYANGNEVMSISEDGLTVKGRISAISGYIGSESSGFTVGSTSISNGKTSLSDANNGIYIGTDGIALGNSDGNGGTSFFKVDNQGNVTVKNLTVLGQMSYKDNASQSVTPIAASRCSGGIGGGNTFNGAISARTSRVSNFWVQTLTADYIWLGTSQNQLYVDENGYVRAYSN